MFSIINFEPSVAKNIAIKITEKNTNINSIIEDKIISFLENPKILIFPLSLKDLLLGRKKTFQPLRHLEKAP